MVLTSDRGPNVWTKVCRSLGVSQLTTTSFHLQTNGMIEHFHTSLKTALRAPLAGSVWFVHLPLVLLGLWSVPKEDTWFSISKAVFGSPFTVPGEFLDSTRSCLLSFSRRLNRLSVIRVSTCRKSVRFHLPAEVPSRLNPHCVARYKRICSAEAPPFLLGGVLWRIQDNLT